MSLTLRGDLSKFGLWLAKAQQLATGRLSRGIAPKVAGTTLKKLAEAGKSARTNPQGRAWTRTKDGAALKWPTAASVRAEIRDGKVRLVVSGPKWVKYQHSGWSRQRVASSSEFFASMSKNAAAKGATRKRWRGPARRILPKGAIPKRWGAALNAALNAGWRSFMGSTSAKAARK